MLNHAVRAFSQMKPAKDTGPELRHSLCRMFGALNTLNTPLYYAPVRCYGTQHAPGLAAKGAAPVGQPLRFCGTQHTAGCSKILGQPLYGLNLRPQGWLSGRGH